MLQEEKVERKRMFDMLQAITKKQLPVWQKYYIVMTNKKPEEKDFFQLGCF